MKRRGVAPLDLVVALAPALLTIFLAMRRGGYFPGSVALAASEVAVLLAVIAVAARRPVDGWGPALGAGAVALGALAAWTLASSGWSHAPERALVEYDRVLLYLLVLVACGTLAYSARRLRWTVYGMAGAISAVATVAIAARAAPELIGAAPELAPDRLSYPLTYWNGLGLLAGVGAILCSHIACDRRAAALARVAGSAALPLLAATIYLTVSRGAVWATVGGLLLYLVAGRPGALIGGALAAAPPAIVAIVIVEVPSVTEGAALQGGDPGLALTIAACCLAAGVLRALLLPLDGLVMRLPSVPRPVVGACLATILLLVAAGSVAAGLPSLVHDKASEFQSGDRTASAHGPERLLSADSNGRRELWHVALASFVGEPTQGTGAGTFPLEYARNGLGSVSVQDAHSLYAEVLGELGLPGAAALGLALLVVLGGFALRACGPDRALFTALLAAGLAWSAHAAVDWDWELPAVTLWLFALGGASLARQRPESDSVRSEPDAGGTSGWRGVPWLGLAGRAAVVAACVAVTLLPVRVALSEARLEQALAALESGDCASADERARAALAAQGDSARAHHVRAFCFIHEGRWRAAVAEMTAAMGLDPANWELRHGLAVARAGAGLDPIPQARHAVRLNPRSDIAGDVLRDLRRAGPDGWRAAARRTPLLPP